MISTALTIALASLMIAQGQAPSGAPKDKAGGRLTVKGRVTAGVEAVGEVERSSKFTEYRDVPRGSYAPALDLDLARGDGYFHLAARNIRQDDQRLRAELGRYGRFWLAAGYDETPHRFSFFGATPYVEREPGVFTLNDVIRSDAQALVPTGTSTNIAAARALVSSFLASAAPVDLGLRRKEGRLELVYTPSVPFRLNVSASRETRSGNRPIGASLGFSDAIELAEPIRHRTTNLDASLEYRKGRGGVRAGISASLFDNEVQTMVWDNPYRITDSTYPQAYVAGNGTARGRTALWPSNDAVRFYAAGSVKPLAGTRISAAASYSLFDQNEKLLPFTINTAIPGSDPNAANALSPPRETAQARAGVTSLDLTVSSRLSKSVSLAAGLRYYDFANRLTALEMPEGFALVDQLWEDGAIAAEPYSFSRFRLFGDLTWRLFDSTSLTAGYSLYNVRRHQGAEPAEMDRTDENAFKVSIDSHPWDWLTLRASYLGSDRDWSLDDTFVAYIPGFNFKRYFEASRNRRSLNALVGLSPIDRLDIELTYAFGRDDYPRSSYGLLKDDFVMAGLDASYALSKSHTVYGFYVHELYATDQADRQSGAVFSTSPLDDWTARLKDSVHTFGAGQAIEVRRGRLGLDVSGSYSRTHGSSRLFSPPGGTPDVAVNFTKPLDATSWWTAQALVRWTLMKGLQAVFTYWYEAYTLADIVRNDAAVDYAAAGAIFLGAREPGYKYHVGSVRLVYFW